MNLNDYIARRHHINVEYELFRFNRLQRVMSELKVGDIVYDIGPHGKTVTGIVDRNTGDVELFDPITGKRSIENMDNYGLKYEFSYGSTPE